MERRREREKEETWWYNIREDSDLHKDACIVMAKIVEPVLRVATLLLLRLTQPAM